MRFTDFDLYKDLLLDKAGLYLSADKSYLLDSRLTSIASKWGYPSVTSMTHALRGIAEPGLIKDFVEAMIDPETWFFRDPYFFNRLRDETFPAIVKNRKGAKQIRIWIAGCSTGQEAYSLAIFLKEHALLSGIQTEIIASDISSTHLTQAQNGQYNKEEAQRGLSIHYLLKYFDQTENIWTIKPELRNMVKFQYFNLLDSMAPLGQFDLILCRHVLDQFDYDIKDRVIARLNAQLTDGGFLFTDGDAALAL